MVNNKLFRVFNDVERAIGEHQFANANRMAIDAAAAFEKAENYPAIREILYDLAFLHKEYVESNEMMDAQLQHRVNKAIQNIRNFNLSLIN